MGFTQLIPFNTSKGGNTPNLCLDNVRRGYGIANKYGSAWEAWEHTQQHPDRNVPAGLAVPLYYSYTATIDGVTANYGHINVQLPNGTVWSDGNIYPSIDGYLANHSPKFVGWGTSINDFRIIGGDNVNDTADINDVRIIFAQVRGYNGLGGQPNALTGEVDGQIQGWVGKSVKQVLEAVWNDKDAQNYRQSVLPGVYQQAATPQGVKPYDGQQLFVKE